MKLVDKLSLDKTSKSIHDMAAKLRSFRHNYCNVCFKISHD